MLFEGAASAIGSECIEWRTPAWQQDDAAGIGSELVKRIGRGSEAGSAQAGAFIDNGKPVRAMVAQLVTQTIGEMQSAIERMPARANRDYARCGTEALDRSGDDVCEYRTDIADADADHFLRRSLAHELASSEKVLFGIQA